MRRCDAHVQRITSACRVADHHADAERSQSLSGLLQRGRNEPIGMPKLHGHGQLPWPFFQILPHCLGMLRSEMWWQLNERWPHALLQGEQACDEVVRGAVAIFKAPIMRNDLRKFATELKAFRRRLRPFAHFFRRVNAVMCGVEFNGFKLRSVCLGIQPSRRFSWIRAADPLWDIPRRSACGNRDGSRGILQEPRSLGQGKEIPWRLINRRKFSKFHTGANIDALSWIWKLGFRWSRR